MIITIEIQSSEELNALQEILKKRKIRNITITNRFIGEDMYIEKRNLKSDPDKVAGIWKDYSITIDELRDRAWTRS